MKKFFKVSLLACCAVGSLHVSAQDTGSDNHTITIVVPNVAILDLEATSKNFTSTFVQPTLLEAGQKVSAPVDNALIYLQYSSILPSIGVASRKVQVSASPIVPGVNINVVAATSSSGFGTKGVPTASVLLTTGVQDLITGIGSAYTETGAGKGHQLTYSFTAPDANFASLRSVTGGTIVTVTYTLVDI